MQGIVVLLGQSHIALIHKTESTFMSEEGNFPGIVECVACGKDLRAPLQTRHFGEGKEAARGKPECMGEYMRM